MINKNSKIFIAGHNGLVGSAVLRKFKKEKFLKIILSDKKNVNFLDQKKTFEYLKKSKPKLVIVCAAKVGGIAANKESKSSFIYENLQIQNNLIHGSYLAGVKNLIFLGSSCIYPKKTSIPIKEEFLLSGKLEETNDAYAIAKIAGLKMCKFYSENYNVNFKTLMPCNLYGPGDNYNLKTSHFFPALVKKLHKAKKLNKKFVEIWGSGKPKRELMHSDDVASAVFFFMNKKIKEDFINIGTGKDFSINWYAKFIMKKLNFKVKIKNLKKIPDGTMRKLLDCSKAKKYGWTSSINLSEGFFRTYKNINFN